MISNIRKDIFCVEFDGQFGKMRKAQSFCVYSITDAGTFDIQSKSRFGRIDISNDRLILSANHSNGAYAPTLTMDMMAMKAEAIVIQKEELDELVTFIREH